MKRADTEINLRVVAKPKKGTRNAIVRPLIAFNKRAGLPDDYKALAVPIVHPRTHKIIGGLWGGTWARWLFIELLVVPESMRGAGLGTRIMHLAEDEAMRRGCVGVWLNTLSFQARPFYERLGYRRFGAIRDIPPGSTLYFMKKRLLRRSP
jgi:GNAT superfamily N-acetyltransferase